MLSSFYAYIAMLHDRGVDCGSLHPKYILVTPSGDFVLREYTYTRVGKRPLSTLRRILNLRKLLKHTNDIDSAIEHYLEHACVSTSSRELIRKFAK